MPIAGMAAVDNDSMNSREKQVDDEFYSGVRLGEGGSFKIKNLEFSLKGKARSIKNNQYKNDNGFFIRDGVILALLKLGFYSEYNNINKQSHWGLRDKSLVGYGYRLSDSSSFLFGVHISEPNLVNNDVNYVSFTVGSNW